MEIQQILKTPYLRVRTPQTVNGTDLKIDEESEKIVYKETHLPLTAKKFLEKENETLPTMLRHKLEVVENGGPGPTIPENKKIPNPDIQGDGEFQTIGAVEEKKVAEKPVKVK